MHLTGLDFVAIGVPFAIILVVTLFLRRYVRSVADFLASGRCAGRYLICTALGATGSSVMAMCTLLEIFSKTGFSLRFWETFTGIFYFIFTLLGLIAYRFRETRALTFHQFFETRYSKGVRVFASFLAVFSGLFNFGIQPAVGARFFVYFCGIPPQLNVGDIVIPSFIPIMILLMSVSLCFALTGGHISVMVTDCLEGIISSIFYLIVAAFIVLTVSVSQMRGAMLAGGPGNSFVDPFDIGGRTDFNGWYIVIGLALGLYTYRGNAWNQAFAASARSAHEGRMAMILGTWRSYSYTAMAVLVSIAAFTLLHHGDFASQQQLVEQGLRGVDNQLQTQMRMPMALGVLLAPGVRGCFLAVLLFGLLASQGVQLHNYGSTILQDVVLPLRKKPFGTKEHLRWLQLTVFGVAVFTCVFSILFKPLDYLAMIAQLIGAIYLGGIGLVVWGGLYWKRGTTAGAWTALILGGALGVAGNLIQQFWGPLNSLMIRMLSGGAIVGYLKAHPDRSPFNGMQIAIVIAGVCAVSYVVVSLLTSRRLFDLDKMLNRGVHHVESESVSCDTTMGRRSVWSRMLNFTNDFTRGDKALTIGTFAWMMLWQAVALVVLIWVLMATVTHERRFLFGFKVGAWDLSFPLAFHRPSPDWWFDYTMITGVWLTLVVGAVVTVWFTIGSVRDLISLFKVLKTAARVAADDGTVRDESCVEPSAQRAEKKSEELAESR